MNVKQTPLFARQKKKLHANQIVELDKAVQALVKNPDIGEQKQGDLRSIRVFKFKMLSQQYLLVYQIMQDYLILLSLGSHENFYRDLKRTL